MQLSTIGSAPCTSLVHPPPAATLHHWECALHLPCAPTTCCNSPPLGVRPGPPLCTHHLLQLSTIGSAPCTSLAHPPPAAALHHWECALHLPCAPTTCCSSPPLGVRPGPPLCTHHLLQLSTIGSAPWTSLVHPPPAATLHHWECALESCSRWWVHKGGAGHPWTIIFIADLECNYPSSACMIRLVHNVSLNMFQIARILLVGILYTSKI